MFPMVLYHWYLWLDARFLGTAVSTIGKKLLLDQFVISPPILVAFYICMSLMERKDDIFKECRYIPILLSLYFQASFYCISIKIGSDNFFCQLFSSVHTPLLFHPRRIKQHILLTLGRSLFPHSKVLAYFGCQHRPSTSWLFLHTCELSTWVPAVCFGSTFSVLSRGSNRTF